MDGAKQQLILIADDNLDFLGYLEHLVVEWGYQAVTATDRSELFRQLAATTPSAVILDLQLGESNGLDIYRELLAQKIQVPVLFLTAYGSINEAVAAIKLGAYDFLTKPPEPEHLKSMLQMAIVEDKHRGGTQTRRVNSHRSHLIGEGRPMRRVRELLAEVASTNASVLISGESGTGKELVARELHTLSSRARGPFVPVNMAALPPTLAESVLFGHAKGAFTGADRMQDGICHQADRGTLFLDEIGELGIELQPKLLRFLQEQTVQRVGATRCEKVDVRIVAATNRSLRKMIAEGTFREDLFFRLNVVPIKLPPLRDRREDIPVLADAFLRKAAQRSGKVVSGFAPAAMNCLMSYDWPGNVRELENVVERLVIFSRHEIISQQSIPTELFSGALSNDVADVCRGVPEDESLSAVERSEKRLILDALARTNGNVVDAARVLGLGQATVYRKIKNYGIDRKRLRRSG